MNKNNNYTSNKDYYGFIHWIVGYKDKTVKTSDVISYPLKAKCQTGQTGHN